jgi:hypothetical protein
MKWTSGLIVALAFSLPLLSSAQELKSIAGHWSGEGANKGTTRAGEARGYSNSGVVELTIAEDGSGVFFFPRTRAKVPATFTVSDGKILYETAVSKGGITLSESGGKRLLKGEAVRKDGTGESWFEMKPKQ